MLGLTKTAALEAGHDGVRVVAISPGPVKTELFRSYYDESKQAELEDLLSRVASHRITTPREVARCALFLASDDAAQFTGHTLNLDGGVVDVR